MRAFVALIVLCAGVLFSACDKNNVTGPTEPIPPNMITPASVTLGAGESVIFTYLGEVTHQEFSWDIINGRDKGEFAVTHLSKAEFKLEVVRVDKPGSTFFVEMIERNTRVGQASVTLR